VLADDLVRDDGEVVRIQIAADVRVGEQARMRGVADALAVRLAEPLERGVPVTLVGDGVTLEQHAAVADTIGYEHACGIRAGAGRGERAVVGA
jgi:alanine racemase